MVPQNSKSEKSMFAQKIEKWIFSEGSVSFDVMYHIDKDIKHEVTKVVFSLKKVKMCQNLQFSHNFLFFDVEKIILWS